MYWENATGVRTSFWLILTIFISCGSGLSHAQDAGAESATDHSTADQAFARLLAKLDEPTEFDFLETPIEDVAKEISERHDVLILLDTRALESMGLSPESAVTKTIRGVKLGTALSLVLDDLELVLSARDNVLLITSEESQRMITRVYGTEGLVPQDADWDHLIETLISSIEPDSWEELGGLGSISVFQRNLIVSQGFETHVQLVGLLKTLRKNIALAGGPKPIKRHPSADPFGRVDSGSNSARDGKHAESSDASKSGGGGFFQIENTDAAKLPSGKAE